MTSPSKAKGNGWERECAKILSDIFGYHFERNKNGSGAFVGGSHASRKSYLSNTQLLSFMADILPPDEMTKICVECKFYKEFPFHHLLIDKEIPLLDGWIDQQLDIVDETNFWFVTFKINHAGSFIVIKKTLCDFIDDKLKNHSIYHHKSGEYIVTDFENFLKLYKNQIFEKCK